MSTRNRDKIKQLEHELGRYEKRCGDLMKLNAQLSKRSSGVTEISIATDALLAQVAIIYGEDVIDEDTGLTIGMRLTLPKFDVRKVYRQYEVHARRDGENYIIGVGLRDDPADGKRESAGNVPESAQERSEYEKREMTPPEDKNAQSASQSDLQGAHDGADIS
nr:MAG TPA: hypothetical protein [Caudoviricetes sp.]